ncbi:unnamed protein product [Vicia faba]|uniref:F-box domain-containing protein n=1 Tax=Vicia faba TaxID=3906 RepID=A0AAV0ZT51_VICFA|nr:unnamed protein product [Vicia faba]
MAMEKKISTEIIDIEKLPDHVVIEILIRTRVNDWTHISCVKKQWASLFQTECFWQAALSHIYPSQACPGPIPPPLAKRRFMALHISQQILGCDNDIQVDEIVGQSYLFLKEQLQLSNMSPHSGILHGTIIADQFLTCGKSRDVAHELSSMVWLAVIDSLEENHHTFCLLKRLAHEGDVFLPHPYATSVKVQWRVFEKLFTDFRDCFNHIEYYDMLACAKSRFQPIPSTWLGY